MSKRALNKDLFREIHKTRSRFISILMLVIIAVCFLFGLRMAAPDMKASMDAYLDRQQLMDVHIMSTLGLTQSDVDAMAQVEGTQLAEGCYTVDALASGGSGQDTLSVKAISLGLEGINAPSVIRGRLPESADECLVEDNFLTTLGLDLGDQITLDTGTGAYEDALNRDTFTIVGTGKSPLYVSLSRGNSTLGSGNVAAILTLHPDAFALDYFTDLYLLVDGAEGLNAYDDSYEDLVEDYKERLEAIQAEREEARTLEVKGEAQQEIDDAWVEYNDAKAEADQELADAQQELDDAWQELTDGWKDYEDGLTELADARVEIQDGQAELDDAKDTLNQSELDYEDGRTQYQDGEAAYADGLRRYQDGYDQYQQALTDFQAGYDQYMAALQEYEAGETAYADGLAQYQAGEAAYADGLTQYEAGEAAYADGYAQYEAGEAAYTDGLAQYEAGEAAYADGLTQYEAGEAAYEEGLAQYQAGEAAYEEGLAQYQAGEASYEENLAEYEDGLSQWQTGTEALEESRKQLLEAGYDQYMAALKEYEAGEAAYADGLARYQAGEAAYADGLTQYEAGEAAYADGYAQYEAGEAAYADGLAQYEAGEAAYADGLTQYEAGEAAYEEGLAQYQAGEAAYADGLAQYEAGEAAYEEGLAQYQAGEAAYEEGLAQYQAGEASYEENLAEYEDGLSQWQTGTEALEESRKQLLEAGYDEETVTALLAEQQAQLDSAKAVLDENKEKLDAGRAQLDETKAALEDSRAQLDGTKATLADSRTWLDETKATLEASRAQLDETKATLEASRTRLNETKATLESSRLQLDDSRLMLEDSRTRLDETQATLESSRTQLDDSRLMLEDSRAQLDGSRTTLEASRTQLDQGKAALEENGAIIAAGQSQLESSGAELASSKTLLDQTRIQLDGAKAQLSDARSQLDDGWQSYYDGLDELKDARSQLADGEQELADAYVELTDGQKEYEDGLSEYNDAKADAEQELADARQEIEDGQREIDDLDPAEWYILDRGANIGFASYQQDAQRMTKLATLFPTVFFLVAALVCLTAMTRMVEEQRVQIGGLKALGYSKLDIARKYVGYGLMASLIGGVIGLVLGGIGIPWVIVSCWKVMYDYPGVTLTFSWPTALACLGAAVACCTLAVLVAALAALRATPAALMRPRAPQPGKRVWLEYLPFLWKRMSFSQKVTARNLFRYKKRFWMTVIGIAGCTGLMITGFGLRDSIMDVVDLQFGKISTYSAVLYTAEGLTEAEQAELTQALEAEAEIEQYAPCYLTSVTLESPTYSLDGNLLAVDAPSDLDGFWHFRDRLTKNPVEMQTEGALISEKTAELLGLSVGDTVTVVDDNQRGQVPITGIVENYVQHYVYLTKAAYTQAFGETPENTQILLSYPDTSDWEGMGGRLLELDSVTGIYYLEESQKMIKNQLDGVYPAVIIIISAAAALAFVVLYNLSSINITERLRELATLKVLGFRDRETRDYVFRENIVLTLIGMALGLVMGKFFHAYLITTVEVELVMFGRQAHPLSYLLALLLTIVFALLVNQAAGRKLRKIDMVESLKTVE